MNGSNASLSPPSLWVRSQNQFNRIKRLRIFGDLKIAPQGQSVLIAAISELINSTSAAVTRILTIFRRSCWRGTGRCYPIAIR